MLVLLPVCFYILPVVNNLCSGLIALLCANPVGSSQRPAIALAGGPIYAEHRETMHRGGEAYPVI